MNMNPIDYKIPLTGSKLFDIIMFNAAKELCEKYPGLKMQYTKEFITLSGELNDSDYAKYKQEMFD